MYRKATGFTVLITVIILVYFYFQLIGSGRKLIKVNPVSFQFNPLFVLVQTISIL
jgi:hypothetical protein